MTTSDPRMSSLPETEAAESSPSSSAAADVVTCSEDNPSQSPSSSMSPQQVELPLSWPSNGNMNLEWIQNLMFTFEWSSRNIPPSEFSSVLPVQVFDSLALRASKLLHKEPNCVRIDPSDSDSVVVVGDVHGQLHDVLSLLGDAGFPDQSRFFIFNGDYVDRGAWGLETFLLLLACKVKFFHIISQCLHWLVISSCLLVFVKYQC